MIVKKRFLATVSITAVQEIISLVVDVIADRIRNMSDEELASWYVIKCEIMMGTKCQKPFKTCKDCILDWLQAEADRR